MSRRTVDALKTDGSSLRLISAGGSKSERVKGSAASAASKSTGTVSAPEDLFNANRTPIDSGEDDNDSSSILRDDGENEDESSEESEEPTHIKLYKSPRFNGYLTIALASVINYAAGIVSNDPLSTNAVPASDAQLGYAVAVALISATVAIPLVILHLDRFSCLAPMWAKAFSKKSKIELYIIVFLVVWWFIATMIQTSVRGIAGDGKEHFNLYYSTWVCCYTAVWTLERKLTDAFDFMPFHTFVQSWPNRAPGWIAVFFASLGTLIWYVDIFVVTASSESRAGLAKPVQAFYDNVSNAQYQYLLFLTAATLLPSIIFVFIELVRKEDPVATNENAIKSAREEKQRLSIVQGIATNPAIEESQPVRSSSHRNLTGSSPPAPSIDLTTPVLIAANTGGQKSTLELIIEGSCLVLLVIGWIPGVIIATTPGGIASLVGNAYFFTWATTISVMETLVWFIHDVRANVHALVRAKEEEYKRNQRKVYEDAILKSANDQHQQQLQSQQSHHSRNHSSSFGSLSSIHGPRSTKPQTPTSQAVSPTRQLDVDGSSGPSDDDGGDGDINDDDSSAMSVASRSLTRGQVGIDDDGMVHVTSMLDTGDEPDDRSDVGSTSFFDAMEEDDVEAVK